MPLRRFLPSNLRLRLQSSKIFTGFLVLVTLILVSIQILHLYNNTELQSSLSIPQISIDSDILQSSPETTITEAGSEATSPNDVGNKEEATETKQQDSSSVETKDPDLFNSTESADDDDVYFKGQEFIDYQNTAEIDKLLNRNSKLKMWLKEHLLNVILGSKPACGAVNDRAHYNKNNPFVTSWEKKLPVLDGKIRENNIVDPIRSKKYLSSYLQLKENEIEAIKGSHSKFLEQMPKELPLEFSQKLKGNGILYPGGGNYNWLVLISLKMLRSLGSKLPVEVFIPTDAEYSIELCENVFPLLGAKCIVMSKYVNTREFKLKGYQLKSMALLLSSFENVLMLDSDNIPVKNPDYLFESEPFISNGLVVWPDFWRRSTSPTFYEIAGIHVNETKQVRFSYNDDRDHPKPLETLEDYNEKISYHDLEGTFPEASSESGQLLLNKRTHAQVLFLSLYYNYYGPNYYYGLISQGQAGEGDKDTFLIAAHRLNLPYYQVQEFIREYGKVREDGGIEIAAMGQYDPLLDYQQSQNYEKFKSNFPYDSSKNNYKFHKFSKSDTLFLHCNSPKLYPWNVQGKGLSDFLNVKDGTRRRLYSEYLYEEIGYDFEAKIFETIRWVICEHGDLNIKGMKDVGNWCDKVNQHIEYLATDIEGIEGSS